MKLPQLIARHRRAGTRASASRLAPGVLTLLTAGLAPPLSAQTTSVVVQSGDAAPDGDGTHVAFSIPTLNNAGQVAFWGTLTGTSKSIHNDSGFFRGDAPGSVTQLVREDDPAPDGNGKFDAMGEGLINSSGQVAFSARFDFRIPIAANGYVLADGSSPLVQLPLQAQASPDGNGEFFQLRVGGFNDRGQSLFGVGLTDTSGGTSDDFGVYVSDITGASTTVVRKGDPSPDGNGTISTSPSYALDASGAVAYGPTLTGTTSGLDEEAIFVDNGTTVLAVARGGDAAPGGGNYVRAAAAGPSIVAFNDSGQVAFESGITSVVGGGIFVGDGVAPVVEISRGGDPAPDGNGIFSGHLGFAMNNAGQVLFRGTFSDHVGGSLAQFGYCRGEVAGPLQMLVRGGQAAPDGNGTLDSTSFSVADMNEAGQLVFQSGLTGTSGGSSDNSGIFFHDDTLGLLQVARLGDSLLGSTITSLSFQPGRDGATPHSGNSYSGLNDSGQVAYLFQLADGTHGIALWSSTTPITINITGYNSGPGTFTINWTTTPAASPVDIYRSVDLMNWGSPVSTANATGTFTDSSLPGTAAWYVLVEAGVPYP